MPLYGWIIYVIVYAVLLVVYGRAIIWLYHKRNERMQIKYIMHLRMQFPDATIVFTSMAGSEPEALKVLKAKMVAGEDGDSVHPKEQP